MVLAGSGATEAWAVRSNLRIQRYIASTSLCR